jgi:hypothetical protein
VLLADITLTDVLWAMFAFFFFVIFLWILFGIISDIFRSHDLSGWAKALWCIALVILPWLTMFIYLIVRGKGMAERSMAAQQKAQAQFNDYIRQTASTGTPTEQIKAAKDLLDSGAISQAEFDQLKSKALAG